MYDSLLMNLATASKAGIELVIEPHIGDSLICRARQEMTWKFLQTDCTHFMQIDDDVQLPDDGIVKLVKANKPIVGGTYRLKYASGKVLALRTFEQFDLSKHLNELIKIRYLSTGCFLQQRRVIATMWKRYENLKYYANEAKSDERRALYMPMIHEEGYLSEDWAYCQRAIDVGYDIYLHTGVLCGHWGLHNYNI